MNQLWVLPEQAGEPAGYKFYPALSGTLQRVYGGEDQTETFAARTILDVGLLNDGQTHPTAGEFLAFLVQGKGTADGVAVEEGDLIRGRDVNDLTIALFGAPADADNVKGRLDQGFTEIIFGLPQSEPDKVLAQLDKITAVVEQVR